MTSIAPFGLPAATKKPWSSTVGPGNVIASPSAGGPGEADAAVPGEAEVGALVVGSTLPPVGPAVAGAPAGAHASSSATADPTDKPRSARRRNASRRLMIPSAQSSPTSPAR